MLGVVFVLLCLTWCVTACSIPGTTRYVKLANGGPVQYSTCETSWQLYEFSATGNGGSALPVTLKESCLPYLSNVAGTFSGDRAVDGDTNTEWIADGDVYQLGSSCWDQTKVALQWIIFDMGSSVTIEKLEIIHDRLSEWYTPTSLLIYCSQDAVTWSTPTEIVPKLTGMTQYPGAAVVTQSPTAPTPSLAPTVSPSTDPSSVPTNSPTSSPTVSPTLVKVVGSCVMDLRPGHDLRGNDMFGRICEDQDPTMVTYSRCIERCCQEAGCVAFTFLANYVNHGGQACCWLKNTVGTYNIKADHMSGNVGVPHPTVHPTMNPTAPPSLQPSHAPSVSPMPSPPPSNAPSSAPSAAPSAHPSPSPSAPPSGLCPPVSTTYGRCGPSAGRCNKYQVHFAIYCNTTNGWCGSTAAHRDAQPGDEYDWEPTSCTYTHAPSVPPTTAIPTTTPTAAPATSSPTANPTTIPTSSPTMQPTVPPSTSAPTKAPTSSSPTVSPTVSPSAHPTVHPTGHPSPLPTVHPTGHPSPLPTAAPSAHPSVHPTGHPSPLPTTHPTAQPSTAAPSAHPTVHPTGHPSP
eukprot:Hpha_TRINITY_DN15991_c0_g5::TRINITY_DN15991_c0_g5_i7::g.74630::m.74630